MISSAEYIQQHKDRFINELLDLLKMPSVSADPGYQNECLKTADEVKNALKLAGCQDVEICQTPGLPVVFGQIIKDKNLPTVLVYGHYDVQPPDPINLWKSPPFEPVIHKSDEHPDGAIYARGACDDKGQFYMHVKAIEYLTKTDQLPCNVKFMIEGEEEVGSEHLENFIKSNKEKLANDVILISDTGMINKETPTITTGIRGLSYVEVTITGPNRDLHSGLYGGAVANPINILTQMIASLQDKNNQITIPGFYNNVRTLSAEEKELMKKIPFNAEDYKSSIGIKDVHGEKGYTTIERNSIRPTLDVNGIWGGYIGEGAKTVIPSQAHAKISMRLVPDQDWKEITQLFKEHFEKIAPDSVSVEVKPHHGGQGYVTPINSVEYQAAAKAFEATFDQKPVPLRSGGSIPIVSMFEEVFDSKTILMGFGLDSDAIHSPNEHFGIWNFLKGIETIPYFYHYFTEIKSNG